MFAGGRRFGTVDGGGNNNIGDKGGEDAVNGGLVSGWRCFHGDYLLPRIVLGVDNLLKNDTKQSRQQARMQCMHAPSIQNADLAKTKGLAPNRRH